MDINILDQENTVLNVFLSEIRNKDYQQNMHLFRRNMRRCGNLLAYEISKTLDFSEEKIETPLGIKGINLPQNNIVLICILRASLPFYDGFLDYFETAESGFIGAYRKEKEGSKLDIQMDYYAFPKIDGKTLILIDPMLASGKSMVMSINELLKLGKPERVIVASLICSQDGLGYLKANTEIDISFYTASKDLVLNDKSYIVPGLGDAGDLAYGVKE
ncbi:MAG: uracil phosphoribosyltransferase [Cytophagales bacterium]|nr:uracil phosphoribosyltransferase [Cytophagales bacterium]